jgi:hypothetical protein
LFEVESVQFAGQQHTWRVSALLQKGTDVAARTFRLHLSQALRLIGQVV